MLRNYLTIALRHLSTHKLYSAINIVGLAVGLTCVILIATFVRHELSFDKSWKNSGSIYRISRDFYGGEGSPALFLAANAPQVVPLMKNDFPDVIEAGARIFGGRLLVARDDQAFYESNFRLTDPDLFRIFDFEWQAGDPATALAEPFTVVLTESMAVKYFGDEDPMGQTLTVENQMPVKVTGVVADLPENTHLKFEFLASLETMRTAFGDGFFENWGSNNFHSYFLLREGHSIEELESQFVAFMNKHYREGADAWTGLTAFPVEDIYLKSDREFEYSPEGSMNAVYTFGAIALFILLIACINFMNLSTARSAQRAKEVGMRKVMGASHRQLVLQFLGESILLALIAVVIAVALAELLLPGFNAMIDRELSFPYLSDARVVAALIGLALFVGIAAGSYPAFYLSAFRPAPVLKGDFTRGAGGAVFRKILVVAQFAISIALIIATAIVFAQMRYAGGLDLGYQKEHVVVLQGSARGGLGSQWEAMRERFVANPQIVSATASNLVPGNQNTNSFGVRYEGGDPEGRGMPFMLVDFDFFETYDIDVLAGRTFSREFGTDVSIMPDEENPMTNGAYVVNRMAARQMGWSPDEAIGKWFEVARARDFAQSVRGPIIGVVEDIYFESVHTAQKPVVYLIAPPNLFGSPWRRAASLRLTGTDIAATLAAIDETWAEMAPDLPLKRRFLDDSIEALYQDEARQARMFTAFSGLAVFIACLGLFGLASFTTERRTKEIGVRKVFGGSVMDIVRLLTGEFSRLVLLANLIAWPLAWYFMRDWLANFAYRIDMSPWVFLGSALLALVIAWLTVGGLAARAASVRPALALRYE